MKEEKFDALLEETINSEETKTFQKKLYKKINRTLYAKMIRILILLVVICVGSYFALSTIATMDNYNPFMGKHKEIIDTKRREEMGETYFHHLLMETYTSMHFPGQYYYSYGKEDTKDGFSKYTMHYDFMDGFHKTVVGKAKVGAIQFSKWEPAQNDFVLTALQFFTKDMEETLASYSYQATKVTQEIEKMPDSSQLDLSISFEEPMPIEEFLEYKKMYTETQFSYMVSYIHDSIITLGFSNRELTDNGYWENFKGKYPNLFSFQETKEDYENRYTSMLQLMIDNGEFYKTVNSAYFQHGEGTNMLKEEYDRIKDKGLFISGVRVYTSKQDALKLLQDSNVLFTWVNDAKFSIYQNK